MDASKLTDIESLAPLVKPTKELYVVNSLMGSTRLFGDAACHAHDPSRAPHELVVTTHEAHDDIVQWAKGFGDTEEPPLFKETFERLGDSLNGAFSAFVPGPMRASDEAISDSLSIFLNRACETLTAEGTHVYDSSVRTACEKADDVVEDLLTLCRVHAPPKNTNVSRDSEPVAVVPLQTLGALCAEWERLKEVLKQVPATYIYSEEKPVTSAVSAMHDAMAAIVRFVVFLACRVETGVAEFSLMADYHHILKGEGQHLPCFLFFLLLTGRNACPCCLMLMLMPVA